jgi:pimeloyl-ACP methyl ester carboxylesterase
MLYLGLVWGINIIGITSAYCQPVDTVFKQKIGGVNHQIFIRGKSASNPLLLILHGGPGFSESMLFRNYNKALEESYLVVNYDQRGAHLSYNDSISTKTMNVNQFTEDAHDLILFLKEKYHQRKVFLLGHSWGTCVGIVVASKYPDDLYAYIGISQLANAIENEKMSLQYTLDYARKFGNSQAILELEEVEKVYPSSSSGSMALKNLYIQRKWLEKFGGVFFDSLNYKILFGNVSPNEKKWYNESAASKGERFSMTSLWSEFLLLKFNETNTQFSCPIIFLTGVKDYNAPPELAKEYFKRLKAPYKKFIWFKKSAHFIPFEETDKFHTVMKSINKEIIKYHAKR